MRTTEKLFVLLALALTASPVWAGAWAKNSLWNDGRAEVAVYDAQREVYGKIRKFQEQLIIVKEDLRADTLVKADDLKKQKTIRVFKLNQMQKFETENYPYSYMTSVFVKEDDLRHVVKISVGSQEWCGNTFKLYRSESGSDKGTLISNSYFDGEADQTLSLDLGPDGYFEEQLPLSLRELPFKKGYETKMKVWSSLTTNHGIAPEPHDVVLKIEDEETIHGHVGALPSWKVVLKYPNGSDIYWFEKAAPHVLTKMETRDGRKRLLYGRARWSYWDRRLPKPNILK